MHRQHSKRIMGILAGLAALTLSAASLEAQDTTGQRQTPDTAAVGGAPLDTSALDTTALDTTALDTAGGAGAGPVGVDTGTAADTGWRDTTQVGENTPYKPKKPEKRRLGKDSLQTGADSGGTAP
ncbi:MAG: hypothetical protein ACREMX_11440 [Gemmatimonadales bacterium]